VPACFLQTGQITSPGLHGPQAVIVCPPAVDFGVVAARGEVAVARGELTAAGVERGGVAGGFSAAAGSLTGVPHLLQNLEPAGRLVPQFTQNTIVVVVV